MLLTESTKQIFDLAEIGRGSLIAGKHSSWEAAKTGIVTDATESKITVLFLPETQNIQNHYVIKASEVEAGEWTVRYSSDGLESVTVYEGETTDESESATV